MKHARIPPGATKLDVLNSSKSGGHAAVFASAKTRAAIFSALKARRTYATSGVRIKLFVTVTTDQATLRMGEAGKATSGTRPTISLKATGATAPITGFEVVRNGATVATLTAGDSTVVTWTDDQAVSGPVYYYVRALQAPTPTLTGQLDPSGNPTYANLQERAWSSPVWITP